MVLIISIVPPQPDNILLFNITSSSIMASWSPPQFTPDSYNVVYYCQFLCDLQQNASTGQVLINGTSTTHFFSLNAGSNCTVSVTAVFGSNTSSTFINCNSTNTTSTGINNIHHAVISELTTYMSCMSPSQPLLVLLKD